MKKQILMGAALSLGMAALTMSGAAFAEGTQVGTYAELKDCLESTESAICDVTADIAIEAPLTVTEDITLKLGGKTISVDGAKFTTSKDAGMITVNHGAELTINGEGTITTKDTTVYSAIRLTSKEDTNDSKKAILNVDHAIIAGYYYGIVGSGNAGRGNTEVNLYGATIKGLNAGDCFGIYQPQLGVTNVYDGTTITGDAGIIMKSGVLNVYGGTIAAEGALRGVVPFNNGANSTGAAIQIESNDGYSDQMEVHIYDGEFTSKHGYVIDEYKEKEDTEATVQSISVEGGTFTGKEGVIRHQGDLGKFIKAGSFSPIDKIDTFISSYVVANKSYNYSDGYLHIHAKVQPKEDTLPEGHTLDIEHTDYSQASEETQAGMRTLLGAQLSLPAGIKFAQQEDIIVTDATGAEVSELDDEVKFEVTLENVPALAEGYLRKWYVIRAHEDGEETKFEFIDCVYDETANTLTFGSNLFSAFYIGYEDTELPKAPDTSLVDELTASYIALGSLIALSAAAFAVAKARR